MQTTPTTHATRLLKSMQQKRAMMHIIPWNHPHHFLNRNRKEQKKERYSMKRETQKSKNFLLFI